MEEPVLEMRCIVKGTVQGVSFRALTRECALKLGLKGSVKNLKDGSVEIYAQGTKETLMILLESLKKLPSPVKIDSYLTNFYYPKQKFHSFSVAF